jgi:translation elongation factor EF-G
MSSWLPLSPCFYKIALEYFYAPAQSQAYRLYSICKLYRTLRGNKEKFAKVLPFKEAIEKADRDGKLIAYISKMIFVPNKNINDKNNTGSQFLTGKSLAAKYDTTISNGNFFAFTRVFSGKLRVGDTIYLITSVFDKEDNEEKVKAFEFKVSRLYIWMGYHLDQVEEVGAGCICALPDLGEYNVKFATIADNPECPPLNKIKFENNLIKVAIKTKDLSEMGKLSEGLKILKKVDPAIETFYDEKGDIILETSGEVHLDRCLKDLQDEFARVEIEVSEPIVTFKETITATKFRSYTNKKKEEIKKIRAENQQAFKEDNKKVNRDKEDDEDKAKDEEEVEPEMVQESSERLISDTKDSVSGKAPSKSGALAAPGVLKTDSEGRQEQQPGHVSVEKAENLQNKNTSDDNQLNLTESLTNEDATISNGDGHNAAPTQDKDSCSLHEPKPQSVSGTFQKTPSEKSHADKNLTPKKAKASESTKDIDENLSGQKRSKQTLDKDPDQKAKKGTKAGKDLGANTKNNSQKESHKGETKEKTDKKKQNEPKEASRKEGTTKKMLTDAKAGTKDPPEEENDLENKEKLYRWNTESSSFFDTTSEEEPIDPSKAVEEWLYDDDRGTEKKDEEDTRFIYKESNFVYQKKRVEEVKVNRKGVNLKVGNQGFLGLQRKKNHCEVLTQNKKFKVAVRAVGLGPKAAEFIDTHRNKVRKLFGNGPNMKRQADCVKFLKSLFKILEEDKTDPALLKMIIRHLVNFGPHKIGPNLLLCKFAENSETLTGPLLKDIDEFKDIFVRSKRTESYIKDRPDYEQYYAGVSYEELIKSIQVGFELTLEKGPLCNEEVYGCVFIVEDFINCDEENIRQKNLHEKLKKNEEREKREKHVTELEKQIKDKEDQSSSNQMNTTELTSKEASVHKDDVQTLQVPPLQVHEVDHDHHSTDQKDSNMLEMIKNEGISCNKSKNSKSVMTDENISADPYGPISTQMVSAVKKGCTDSFLGAGPRLVHGLILCTVFVDQETLSSVLDSLYMRRAEIIENEFEHLTNMFIVKAHMPIQESFGFFEKIMKLTSGKVSPQLEFYGWQIIDIDPFYQPTTVDVSSP